MKRNILLTTLGNTFDYSRHHYYSYEENGKIAYCEGISNAEPGAKYILSKVPIDKIIVLGPLSSFGDENTEKEEKLRDFVEYSALDPESYSEYRFFCYRIMQFLNKVDIDGNDLLLTITGEGRREILAEAKNYCARLGISLDENNPFESLFHLMNLNQKEFGQLNTVLNNSADDGSKWLKHYLFMIMQDSYKLSPLSANEDITVRFVPTIQKDHHSMRLGNLPAILDSITEGSRSEISLFVDLQGMDIADSHTLINVLFILQNEQAEKISIEEIITTTYRRHLYTSPIEDQKTRLELSELVSGMDAFLQFGKVESIRKYWESRQIHDEHIERLISAMQTVDVGITLCSVSVIETGIRMLQMVFSDKKKKSDVLETMILRVLETGIKYDYGPLLRGDTVDILALVKWAVRKHFFQQALTIIESRVPIDMINSGIFYYATNEEEKEDILYRLNEQYWKMPLKDRYQFDDPNHYFVKFYRRREAYDLKTETPLDTYVDMRLDEVYNPESEIRSFTDFNGKRSTLEQFYKAYIDIGNVRNRISHAQETDVESVEWSLDAQNERLKLLMTSVTEFVDMYERIRSGINPNRKPSVIITAQEFKEYAEQHPIKWKEFKKRKKNKTPGPADK